MYSFSFWSCVACCGSFPSRVVLAHTLLLSPFHLSGCHLVRLSILCAARFTHTTNTFFPAHPSHLSHCMPSHSFQIRSSIRSLSTLEARLAGRHGLLISGPELNPSTLFLPSTCTFLLLPVNTIRTLPPVFFESFPFSSRSRARAQVLPASDRCLSIVIPFCFRALSSRPNPSHHHRVLPTRTPPHLSSLISRLLLPVLGFANRLQYTYIPTIPHPSHRIITFSPF